MSEEQNEEIQAEETEQPTTDVVEASEESTEEEQGEFELVLEGEESKPANPTPDQALYHKFRKEKGKRQEAQQQVSEAQKQIDELRQELTALKGGQAQAVPAAQTTYSGPIFPDKYSSDINGDEAKYQSAVRKYYQDVEAEKAQKQQQAEQAQQFHQQVDAQAKAMADRITKFSQENKVDLNATADAVANVTNEIDQLTGIESSGLYLFDTVGQGSEAVAFYFSKNPGAFAEFKATLQSDPTGMKAVTKIAQLSATLKPNRRKQTKTLEPDQPVVGDGSSQTTQNWQKKYDAANSMSEALKVRREARAAGVTVN